MKCKGGESMKKRARGWLIAGTVLGAAGTLAGMAMAKKSNISMKKIRSQASKMTRAAGHQAGNFISSMGDTLANKLR